MEQCFPGPIAKFSTKIGCHIVSQHGLWPYNGYGNILSSGHHSWQAAIAILEADTHGKCTIRKVILAFDSVLPGI